MKVLLAAPCNLVLEDKISGHSLIGVFHEIRIQIPADAPDIPVNAMIPREWALFAKFGLEAEEEGLPYSLTVDFRWPDGTPFASHTVQAEQPTKNGMAFITRLQAFPMGQNGIIKSTATLNSGDNIVCGPIETEIKVIVERTLPIVDENA